jgi:hypothetical protein
VIVIRKRPVLERVALMRLAASVIALLVLVPSASNAQQNEESLREAAQNPIASLISVPFQNCSPFSTTIWTRVGTSPRLR